MNGFTRIITKHNLVDVLHINLGPDNKPATYAHSSTHLDYIFMSKDTPL
jgi:hypothetical protein